MPLTIGVDPGIKECAFAWWDGELLSTTQVIPTKDTIAGLGPRPDALVVEKPVAQGPRTSRNSTLDLVRVQDRIVQAALAAGLTVYSVPVQVIRRQAAIPNCAKRQDHLVKIYLAAFFRLKWNDPAFRRGGYLGNADRRDAAMCALFNWRDARNQQYRESVSRETKVSE